MNTKNTTDRSPRLSGYATSLHAEFDSLDISLLSQRRSNKWNLYGPGIVPAWVADMDLPPPREVREWISGMALRGDLGYARRADVDPMPGAFSRWAARRHGWEPDPEQMSILVDIVQCLYIAMQAYSEPGDGVLIQTPMYPPILSSVADTGRRQLLNPLVRSSNSEGGFEVDFDHLRSLIDAKTRILVLCNPHNPTGRVFRRDELETFARLAIEHDLVVLADEIHGDVVYPGAEHIPFASLGPDVAARTVTFSSATKSFNIAGLRAALAIFGSAELRDRFHFVPARMLGGLSALNSSAAAMAWDDCEAWLDATLAYLQGNRDYLRDRVARDLSGIDLAPPQATFLAWLDCSRLELEPSPFEFFLKEARVALSDGATFGPGAERCVRLNFATSRQVLREILDRMSQALSWSR
jgi:cystathionine beta-lyase